MSEDIVSSSDDEQILTDIFEILQNDDKTQTNFLKDDIVWAEFRNIHWPSLVRNVYKKDRKLSLWYLDSPSKCFKVPFSKVKKFTDNDVSEKSKKAVENTPERERHESVLIRTLIYLQRKAEGYKDDPAKYFDIKSYYFALCNSNKVNDSKPIEKNVGEYSKQSELINEESEARDFSDEESLPDADDIEQHVEQCFSEQHKFFENNVLDSIEDEPLVNNIVTCIKSGVIDSYLLQIRLKRIKSNYQRNYNDAVKSNNKKVLRSISYDPVKSVVKLKEIASYLMDLFEKSVSGGKGEIIDYIMSVWLPESINRAVCLLKDEKSNPKNACKRLFQHSTTTESKHKKVHLKQNKRAKSVKRCSNRYTCSDPFLLKDEKFQDKKYTPKQAHKKLFLDSTTTESKCKMGHVKQNKKAESVKRSGNGISKLNLKGEHFYQSNNLEYKKNSKPSVVNVEKNFDSCNLSADKTPVVCDGASNNISMSETPKRILRSSAKLI